MSGNCSSCVWFDYRQNRCHAVPPSASQPHDPARGGAEMHAWNFPYVRNQDWCRLYEGASTDELNLRMEWNERELERRAEELST